MHERGEEHLASWIRIGADDDPSRSKEGNGHCSGGLFVVTASYREPVGEVEDAGVGRMLNVAPWAIV